MRQRAGIATFLLPDGWLDYSMYSYHSPDNAAKITLFFDSEVDEPTAESLLEDRLETIRDVLPGFKMEQFMTSIEIGGLSGKTVTFNSQDPDEAVRTRFAAAMLAPRKALVITVQAPIDKWSLIEAAWEQFLYNFTIA